MSFRNLFVIHTNEYSSDMYDNIRRKCESYGYGVLNNPKNYQDELVSKIIDCNYYFSITNDKNTKECEHIFSVDDVTDEFLHFSKKNLNTYGMKILQEKFCFLDDIVEVIFKDKNVTYIEVFISNQVSNYLEDYCDVIMDDRLLSKAMADVCIPKKRGDFLGIKTTKFVIR